MFQWKLRVCIIFCTRPRFIKILFERKRTKSLFRKLSSSRVNVASYSLLTVNQAVGSVHDVLRFKKSLSPEGTFLILYSQHTVSMSVILETESRIITWLLNQFDIQFLNKKNFRLKLSALLNYYDDDLPSKLDFRVLLLFFTSWSLNSKILITHSWMKQRINNNGKHRKYFSLTMKFINSYSATLLIFASTLLFSIFECRVNYTTRFPRRGPPKNIASTTTTSPTTTQESISTTTEATTTTDIPTTTQPKIANSNKKKKTTEVAVKKKNQEEVAVQNKWKDLESVSQKLAFRFIFDNLLPTIESLFDGNHVSPRCQSSLRTVLQDASRLKKYAIQSKWLPMCDAAWFQSKTWVTQRQQRNAEEILCEVHLISLMCAI